MGVVATGDYLKPLEVSDFAASRIFSTLASERPLMLARFLDVVYITAWTVQMPAVLSLLMSPMLMPLAEDREIGHQEGGS